jgi:hypothetical protein
MPSPTSPSLFSRESRITIIQPLSYADARDRINHIGVSRWTSLSCLSTTSGLPQDDMCRRLPRLAVRESSMRHMEFATATYQVLSSRGQNAATKQTQFSNTRLRRAPPTLCITISLPRRELEGRRSRRTTMIHYLCDCNSCLRKQH